MFPGARIARVFTLGAVLVLMTACCTQQGGGSSSASPEEAAGKLATLALELGSYDRALDRGAALAWESTADTLTLELGRELTADEQVRVEATLRGVLGEFLTTDLWKESVAQVYARSFTASELDGMIDFFSSPAGRKVLQMEGTVEAGVNQAMEQVFDGKMDTFIDRIDEALAAEFPALGGGEGS